MLGRSGVGWLETSRPLLLQEQRSEEFPPQMPICTFRGGMLSPRDGNGFHKFQGAREWVSDS